jgi:sugar porter (SP) family MFS transporter
MMADLLGTVVGLYTVGGFFGSLLCIYIGDRLGRKRVIAFGASITIVGAILMATAFGLAHLIVSRLVLGVGTGVYLATVPVWQSEVSRASERGANVVIDTLFIGSGISLALFIDLGFYFVDSNSVSWRFPFAFQIVLLIIVIAFVLVLPESPRWLVKRGRCEEARDILARLLDVEPNSEAIDMDIRDIESSLATSSSESWWGVFKMGEQRFLHRTALAASAQLFQQLCGINAITLYTTKLFQGFIGLDPVSSRICSACIGFADITGGIVAYFTIDRLGRRVLMVASSVILAMSMAILAGTTSDASNGSALIAAVVFVYIFEGVFSIGYSGLPYLYAAEIAPLQHRAAINAISTATLWIFNFLIAEVTPIGMNTIQNRYFIIFAVFNAVIGFLVFFCFPETKGRSLEEIDEIFAQSKHVFDPPRVARNLPRLHIAEVNVMVDKEQE